MPTEHTPEEVVLVEARQPQPVLSVRAAARTAELTAAQGQRLRELWSSIQTRGLAPVGPPFVRYHTFGEVETDLEVGIPVAEATAGNGRVASGELPGGAAIVTWHIGAHDRLGEAYGRIASWLKEHSRDTAGTAWEVYWWIDPNTEPDPSSWPPPAEWRTELIQPIM
jgi:effector-binding domain-containing protein